MGFPRRFIEKRGFTLIELLVSITVIVVLKGILSGGQIKKAEVNEEAVSPTTGEVFLSIDTTVEIPCPNRDGWITVIDENNPGKIVLPDGGEISLLVRQGLSPSASDVPGSEGPEIGEPVGGLVEGTSLFQSQTQVTYAFDAVSGRCSAIVNSWVPRSRMFEDTGTTANGKRLWRALEAVLHLNVKAVLLSDPVGYSNLPPELVTLFSQLPPNRVNVTVQSEHPWTIIAPFAGVLVGSGISGESSGIASSTLNTNGDSADSGKAMAGCSLASGADAGADESFIMFFGLAALALGVVLLRQRQVRISHKFR